MMGSFQTLRALKRMSVLTVAFGLLLGSSSNSHLIDSGRRSIHSRAVQSSATCLPQFNWMDNTLQQSPCFVASYLISACNNGDWNIPPVVNASNHYTPPTTANANGCFCSWAVYNTYQACAFCQGINYQSAMLSWSGYNTNCTGDLLSDTDFYPPKTPIPAETAIPFWATTDPSAWHNGLFDPSMAQSIANEDHSEITEASRSGSESKKSNNTGAIVGGVVGGVLGFLALGLIFYFLRRRHRYARLHQQQIQGASNLKHRPTFSTVRFSPSLLTHWRTGSSGTTATLAGQHIGGKFAGQTAASYMYNGGGIITTPSPGPTLPVTLTGSTSNGGRPPLNSSTSFASNPTMTNSPPLEGGPEYITRPVGKNYAYGFPQPIHGDQGGGFLTTMNVNHSNMATIAPSSTSATAGGGVSAIARNSHAHTLSNDSVTFPMGGPNGEPPEGTVVPFILPPALPEPMGGDSGTGAGITSVPSTTSKHGHGRGPSDSSNTTSNTPPAPAPNPASTTPDLFATAFNAGRRPHERRNPPAYTPISPPLPPGILPTVHGLDGSASTEGYEYEYGGDGEMDGDALSVEAQRAETTLSGTTLRGQGTIDGSGRTATTVGGDPDPNRDREADATQGNDEREESREGGRERVRHGYSGDRKV